MVMYGWVARLPGGYGVCICVCWNFLKLCDAKIDAVLLLCAAGSVRMQKMKCRCSGGRTGLYTNDVDEGDCTCGCFWVPGLFCLQALLLQTTCSVVNEKSDCVCVHTVMNA